MNNNLTLKHRLKIDKVNAEKYSSEKEAEIKAKLNDQFKERVIISKDPAKDRIVVMTYDLLTELLRCCNFNLNAIEIDRKVNHYIDGEEFKKRIKVLLNKIKKLK